MLQAIKYNYIIYYIRSNLMKRQTIYLAFLLLVCKVVAENVRHEHKHGPQCIGQQKLTQIIPQQVNNRLLQNASTHGLSMFGHYSGSSDSTTSEAIKRLFGISSYYYKQVIKVTTGTQSNSIYPSSSGSCGITVPSSYQTSGFDVNLYDMIIFLLTVSDSSSSYVALASPCILVRWPVYGYIQFNLAYVSTDLTKTSTFHKNVYVTMHQMTHILGLNSVFYDKYFVSYSSNSKQSLASVKTTVPGNSSRSMIITPSVLTYVQSYFGCNDTRFGGLLEDEGSSASAGSHWQREVYLDQMMTASQWASGLKISELTLSLLKDSGFYHTVDTTMGESFLFGKNKGCNFAVGITTNNDTQYCSTSGVNTCDFYNQYVGSCRNDSFSNGAKYISAFSSLVCTFQENSVNGSLHTFGTTSKCMTANFGSGANTYCVVAICTTNDTRVSVTANNSTGTCMAGNSSITVGGVVITCPTSISSFCTRKTCTNWCSSQGLCLKGTCLNANFSAIAFSSSSSSSILTISIGIILIITMVVL